MKLRLTLLATLLMLLCAADAFAGMYGAAVSSMDAGHPSIGFGYTAQGYDVKDTASSRLHQNIGYLQLGLGLGGGWEIYARGGISDLTLDNLDGSSVYPVTDKMADTAKPFAGGGFKGRIYDGRVLDIAFFGQGNYYSFQDFEDNGTTYGHVYTLSDYWDASGGVAFQIEIDKAFIYIGPYYYTWQATLNVDGYDYDLKPVEQIGTMGGIRWPLVSGWELDVEGQLADKYVFGAALNYPF